MLAVRWYLRYALSYREVEELLAERGIVVDHVTIYRWVQRFTAELIDAARPSRHVAGDRWFVDESYLKVAGRWVYLYRAIDQHGQVIDVMAAPKRDIAATQRFFAQALTTARRPTEVTTDRAPAYPRVLDELVPEAGHVMEQHANIPIEADHGRLKARTRPMRGVKRLRSAQVVVAGMRSFRICAAVTTNSDSMPRLVAGSRRSSANSPSQSETGRPRRPILSNPRQRNSALPRTESTVWVCEPAGRGTRCLCGFPSSCHRCS